MRAAEDRSFARVSTPARRLLDAFVRGNLRLVLSELTLRELATAPASVRAVLGAVPDSHIEFLRLSEPAAELAQQYLAERVLGPGMLADAEHIAMASVARVNVLVSWNFKHIVNLQRIHGYHDVNRRLGYPALEIRSPREVLGDE